MDLRPGVSAVGEVAAAGWIWDGDGDGEVAGELTASPRAMQAGRGWIPDRAAVDYADADAN